MKVLVFLEHNGNDLLKGPLGALSMARTLDPDGSVAAVLVGTGPVRALASEAGKFGASKVYVAQDDAFDPPLPQPRVDVLEHIVGVGGFDTVLFSNSVLAADVAAGLAARLDAGLNWDLVDLTQRDGELVGRRLVFQDSVLVEVGWRSSVRLALFRPGSFDVAESGGEEPSIEDVTVGLQGHSTGARIVSRTAPEATGSSVQDAEVIVAGGMGLGGPESFSLAENLAGVLGGAVGATRAVVYAGWYPRAAQIGQTGSTVAPKLYIALGISGAVQHKVGMQRAKTIIAINKDPNAPIFEISDLGVVGDVHTIAPALTSQLRARLGA
jgi:electron transfer flavoprotein alpha subunit